MTIASKMNSEVNFVRMYDKQLFNEMITLSLLFVSVCMHVFVRNSQEKKVFDAIMH